MDLSAFKAPACLKLPLWTYPNDPHPLSSATRQQRSLFQITKHAKFDLHPGNSVQSRNTYQQINTAWPAVHTTGPLVTILATTAWQGRKEAGHTASCLKETSCECSTASSVAVHKKKKNTQLLHMHRTTN